MCYLCPFFSVYSQEEYLPENWKNCYTDVQDLFACFHLFSVQELGLTHGILPSQAVWECWQLPMRAAGGKERVLFLRSCKSSTFCQCCILFLLLASKKLLLQQPWLQTKSHLLKSSRQDRSCILHICGTLVKETHSALSKSFSLKCNSFHAAWSFNVKEISIFRERFYSKSYIRLCWGDL